MSGGVRWVRYGGVRARWAAIVVAAGVSGGVVGVEVGVRGVAGSRWGRVSPRGWLREHGGVMRPCEGVRVHLPRAGVTYHGAVGRCDVGGVGRDASHHASSSNTSTPRDI